MFSLEALFCHVDDFCHWFEPRWQHQLLSDSLRRRQRFRRLCLSEVMTILIAFHRSAYRNFKAFYTQFFCQHWRRAFPAHSREGEEVGELSTFFLYFPCTATSPYFPPSSLILPLVRFYPKGSQC